MVVVASVDQAEPESISPVQQVREELQKLAELQEIHRADHGRFAPHLDSLMTPPRFNPEVTLLVVSGGSRGWSGSGERQQKGAESGCAVYVGPPDQLPEAPVVPSKPGKIACVEGGGD